MKSKKTLFTRPTSYLSTTYTQKVKSEELLGKFSRIRKDAERFFRCLKRNDGLVSQLSLQELTVQAGDVSDRLVLRTNCLASTSVCTVTESELIHACNHLLSTGSSLYTTLWEKCQLVNLLADEENSRTILTCSNTSTATDTCSAIHCLVCILLRNQDSVGILSLTSTNAGVTTCLDDLVEC